jgi:hypothetical protein
MPYVLKCNTGGVTNEFFLFCNMVKFSLWIRPDPNPISPKNENLEKCKKGIGV